VRHGQIGTSPFFEADAFTARPVALSLAGEGLAAAVWGGASEDLEAFYWWASVTTAPVGVNAYGTVGVGCLRRVVVDG
jgi:hypothetical protein